MNHDSRRWTGRYPAADRPNTHPIRRRWVPWMLGAVMLTAIAAQVLQIVAGSDPRDALPVGWMLLVPGLFAGLGLSPFVRGPLIAPTKAGYDEFERDALGLATARAYVVLVALLVAAFAWWWWASANGWPVPRSRADWLGCGITTLIVATNLPAFLCELAIPFPTDAEESDA